MIRVFGVISSHFSTSHTHYSTQAMLTLYLHYFVAAMHAYNFGGSCRFAERADM